MPTASNEIDALLLLKAIIPVLVVRQVTFVGETS